MHLSAALVRIPRQGRKPVTPPPHVFALGDQQVERRLKPICVFIRRTKHTHSLTHSCLVSFPLMKEAHHT